MADLTIHAFDAVQVRVVQIDGEPWFVGKDVATTLGYADPTNAVKQHCKGVVKHHPLKTAGGNQLIRVLAEADVLRLIVSSKLPSAERFERWVFEEVLPEIRKTGKYGAVDTTQLLNDPAILRQTLLAYTEKVIALEQQVEAQAPKVRFAEAVGDAPDLQKTAQVAKALGIGPRKLLQFMRMTGVLMRDGLPFQQHIDRGRFRVVEVPYKDRDGADHIRAETRVTGKGVTFLQQVLAKNAPAGSLLS